MQVQRALRLPSQQASRRRAGVRVRAGSGGTSRHRRVTYDTFKQDVHGDHGYPGTTSLALSWDGSQMGLDEYQRMCMDVLRRTDKFENLDRLTYDAPHLALDGRFVAMVSRYRPSVRHLKIVCWTFHSPAADMWQGKETLSSLEFNFSDGFRVPDSADLLLLGAPSCASVRVANASPGLPRVDGRTLSALDARRLHLYGVEIMHADALAGAHLTMKQCRLGGAYGGLVEECVAHGRWEMIEPIPC